MEYKVGDYFFKYLLIEKHLELIGSKKRSVFIGRCVCNKERKIRRDKMSLWKEQHCGCLKKPKKKPSKLYMIWCSMIYRCTKKHNNNYKNYGGRGIKVCDRWINSFQSFIEDMGERPPKTSLDRIDNNGNYCKENCRWATTFEQANNKRNNVFIEYEGNRYTQSQLARLLKVDRSTIHKRYRTLLIKVI